MIISHNLTALNTYKRLKATQNSSTAALEKLSSGLRINKAADDSAGIAISEKMRAQIRGLNQAARNIQDGISLIQTAESGLGEIQNPNLIRLKELAVQAANDTLTDSDRTMIQMEVKQIQKGIDEIADHTHFNGIQLLNVESVQTAQVTYNISEGENISSLGSAILIGNSDNIHNAAGITISAGVNDGMTVKFDGTSYSFTITPGYYNGSSTALYNDINTKLASLGAPVRLNDVYSHWDDTHMRTFLTSQLPGNHTIEVEGTAFNEIFAEERVLGGTYEVLAREADFSIGYTVESGVNDTLNIIENGVPRSIVLTEGAYSRDELVAELNQQLMNAGASITASMSSAIGVNTTSGPGNKHYILEFKHNYSSSPNAIQLVSGNALNPLFMRSAQPGDVWTPQSASSLTTSLQISNGFTVEQGQNEWTFTVDGYEKPVTLAPGEYTSSSLLQTLNDLFDQMDAGIIATEENQLLKLEREMNGSSYTISNFAIKTDSSDTSALSFQVGANSGQSFSVNLTDARSTTLGINEMDLTTRQGAVSALSKIDDAIATISSERAKYGALQNGLEHLFDNVTNYSVNLTAAESRIRDVDMAKEMIELTKSNILSQASEAMLAQANQQTQGVLQLLK